MHVRIEVTGAGATATYEHIRTNICTCIYIHVCTRNHIHMRVGIAVWGAGATVCIHVSMYNGYENMRECIYLCTNVQVGEHTCVYLSMQLCMHVCACLLM